MSTVHIRVIAAAEHYAIPVDQVLEVSEFGDVAPVPGAPPEVVGVRNLRGQVIPVIDLATVLGLSDDAERQRIVITEVGARRGGLAVTEIVDVGELAEATERPESPYLAGAVLADGALVGVIDVPALMNAVSGTVPA
jgi:purine-binding chemotaxis protein CheW